MFLFRPINTIRKIITTFVILGMLSGMGLNAQNIEQWVQKSHFLHEKSQEVADKLKEKTSEATAYAASNVKPTSKKNPKAYANQTVEVSLVRPTDGDTAVFSWKGKSYSTRFLLIDTPETASPRLGKQPIGPEAKEFTKNLLQHAKKIELEFDASGASFDKYGRLLAYVKVDGKYVQEALLREGLARVAYVYAPNTKYVNRFKQVEQVAKAKKRNIWSVPGYVTDRGYDKNVWKK